MNVAFFTELVEKKSDDPQISDFLKMLCRRLNRRIILCYLCGNKRITEREVKMEIIETIAAFCGESNTANREVLLYTG
ncbi:MAG: hypothetical protein V8S95_07605, partial [Odoribacter sp.]